ncbi:MAG TPA: carbamoyl-phosphate synthase (glutamine-hydrolyzing) large subunit [Thermoplasmataceae archaeon]|nr:carbamoyl-phosphate synthase (glutamine-hydrolyzing) large subunit [Thermoplasmataceae archaeon]
MPLDRTIRTVLVIGSGPVVVGQAAEFDYAGSQACLALREEGVRVVLINSNPATIQTDHTIADRIYIEPLTPDTVERVILKENVDSILPTMGGQTGLNLAVALKKRGFLEKHKVRVIGTPVDSIELAEDRRLFHDLMEKIGEPVAPSWRLTSQDFRDVINEIGEQQVIVRTSFSLGGLGGTIVRSRNELIQLADDYFRVYPDETLELERSLEGLPELEYEVIRDGAGNCITVCNMENLDPMGVHTGESLVVTPSQTLSDVEYHMLRDSALRVIGALGIKGACNIQFALDRERSGYYVVEVNPRTSRSSALASKASGYPIARTSAKIALGYLLTEIRNPITGTTFAAQEPSLDYVTVKIPRWPFDKLPVERKIGVQMKSIGEVMGIGRTFEEALIKAIESLETPDSISFRLNVSDEELEKLLKVPNDRRIFAIFESLFRGYKTGTVSRLTGYDEYFITKINNIVTALRSIRFGEMPDDISYLKSIGISDHLISLFSGVSQAALVRKRLESGIMPVFKSIDTCSGEFPAETPYLYSTYEGESEFEPDHRRDTIVVLGSGPNRISQGLEFDYGSVKAVIELRRMGYRTVMVNCNPETVSTDFDISDTLYFEPLTLEHVSNIIRREMPCKVIVQFSGQTGQNLIWDLSRIFGEDCFLGTKPARIMEIEDRESFSRALQDLNIRQPDFWPLQNLEQSLKMVQDVKLPVILRSSFIIGGRAMDIIDDRSVLVERIRDIFSAPRRGSVILSRYLEDATEVDVDFISSKGKYQICGISTHIEEAGTHSGDATMLLAEGNIPQRIRGEIEDIVGKLSSRFQLSGFSNLQVAFNSSGLFVIELNARSSRSLPFVAKATGINWISLGIEAILTGNLKTASPKLKSSFLKVPVFPFNRYLDLDTVLGPEMKSTGEAMVSGRDTEEALRKCALISNLRFGSIRKAVLTVRDSDKPKVLDICRFLLDNGYSLYATPGTAAFLKSNGIPSDELFKIEDMRNPRVDEFIISERPDIVINTPSMTSGSIRDGLQIRRAAIRSNVALFTNINLARAVIMSAKGGNGYEIREIREYW